MTRDARLVNITAMLCEKKAVWVHSLSAEFNRSVRTIERDLAFIQGVGLNIAWEKEYHSGKFIWRKHD